MAEKDYYEILGVKKEASQDEIKKSFRHLARKFTRTSTRGARKPRRNSRRSTRPTRYWVIPRKKPSTTRWAMRNSGRGSDGYKPPSYDDLFRDFGLGDIFDAFSGASPRAARQRSGADLRYQIQITLADAFSGTKNTVAVPHHYTCGTCHGHRCNNRVPCGTARRARGPGRSAVFRRPVAARW